MCMSRTRKEYYTFIEHNTLEVQRLYVPSVIPFSDPLFKHLIRSRSKNATNGSPAIATNGTIGRYCPAYRTHNLSLAMGMVFDRVHRCPAETPVQKRVRCGRVAALSSN